MKNFKEFIEMASFTLPEKINIKGQDVSAIDMQFEKLPRTINKDGMVMNQGSKFVAKIPNENKYVAYDGQGYSKIISHQEAEQLVSSGYDVLPDEWWEKANLL